MTIFEIAQLVFFGGVSVAVLVVAGTVVLAARHRGPQMVGDDRDTELILHGERFRGSGKTA